jgi:hypothetical protein
MTIHKWCRSIVEGYQSSFISTSHIQLLFMQGHKFSPLLSQIVFILPKANEICNWEFYNLFFHIMTQSYTNPTMDFKMSSYCNIQQMPWDFILACVRRSKYIYSSSQMQGQELEHHHLTLTWVFISHLILFGVSLEATITMSLFCDIYLFCHIFTEQWKIPIRKFQRNPSPNLTFQNEENVYHFSLQG